MKCNKVALINGKGGCSKTTSIFHLAGVLSKAGKKTLVVDLDKQRNTSWLFLDNGEDGYVEGESKTVMDWMLGKADIKEVAKASYIVDVGKRKSKKSMIDILPADVRLENDKLLRKIGDVSSEFNRFIESEGYEWVLVDMPPSNKALNDICFGQLVNYVVAPFSSDLFSISGYGDLIDTVNRAREVNEELHILGVFLGRYMGYCAVDQYIKGQLEELLGDMFIDVQIPLSSDIREGEMFHRPISYYRTFSKSKTAYENLVKEMENRIARCH